MPISARTKSFKKSFFLNCKNIWSNLKADIRNAKSISIFKKLIVSKKHGSSLFSVYDPLAEKFLTRLRLKFSHLEGHGFADMINPMCARGADVETTEHFLLRYHFYSTQRLELFDNLERANPGLTKFHLCYMVKKQILLKTLIKILSKL